MKNDILLTGDLEKAINDSGVYDRLIPFGFGKLMPMYSTGVETHVLIIAHSGTEREVGQHVSAQQAYDDAINHVPLPIIGLSFPANQDGLKAIDSLKEWLDKSKKLIEEEVSE